MTKITDKRICTLDGNFFGWLWAEYKNTISVWRYDHKGNVRIIRGCPKSGYTGWEPVQPLLDDDLRGCP